MSTDTVNYGFKKDNEDEFYNVNVVNANLDKIDTEMKRIEDESKKFNQQVVDNTNAIVNANTKLDTHIEDDLGHVRFIGGTNTANAWVCTSDNILWDKSTPPKPKQGSAYRVFVNQANTSPLVSLKLQSSDGTKVSSTFQVLNQDGSQLSANTFVSGAIATVSFNGTNFFLQGSGSGVTARSNRDFNTPGTHLFEVPKGVSKITAYIWGAGGGGGGNTNNYPGGGGGGGAFLMAVVDVTPGEKFNVTVGAGGTGANGPYNGSVGSHSGFTLGSTQYLAGGGGGGTYGQSSGFGKGGLGGRYAVNGAVGGAPMSPENGKLHPFVGLKPSNLLYCFTGGDGGPGGNYGGGGGGGSASDMSGGGAADTTNGAGKAGATYSNFKGADGGGGAYFSEGVAGSYPGGGGSGSGHALFSSGRGGGGRVIFYW